MLPISILVIKISAKLNAKLDKSEKTTKPTVVQKTPVKKEVVAKVKQPKVKKEKVKKVKEPRVKKEKVKKVKEPRVKKEKPIKTTENKSKVIGLTGLQIK